MIPDNDTGFGDGLGAVVSDDLRMESTSLPARVTGYQSQYWADSDDDSQLVTSFIGPDYHEVSGGGDGVQRSPASPPSAGSCSSNGAAAFRQSSLSRSRTYSADSLELHDCARIDARTEGDASRCSASEDGSSSSSSSVDECCCSGHDDGACPTCYDFTDIDAVLNSLADKKTVGVDGHCNAGSRLSFDSLD
jgi:hypothetical protein